MEKVQKVRKYRFRKCQRLKSEKLFQFVYKTGRSVVDSLSVLYILPCEAGRSALGLAVGKALGCAVVRNKVKRKMREVYRVRCRELLRPVHIVWVARKKLVRADLETYDRVFWRLVRRAGLV